MNLRWLSVAIPALALVSYVALLWILYVSRKNRIVRAYTGFIIVMLVWSLTSLLMRISGPSRVLLWNRVMVTAIIFGPVFLYNFSLIFTKTRHRMRFTITAAAGLGLTALNFLGHMVHKIDFDAAGNLQYEIGFGVYIMSVFGIVLTILSALNILHKVRQGAISFKSVQWIIGGIFILLVGSLSNILPTVGTYPVDILANVVNAGMIGYSIFNYRFLNIKFIIRKGMAYTLFTLAMTGVFVSLVYGVESILRNRLGYTRVVLGFSIALIITVFLQPIWRLFQSFSERVYLREEFEQRKILKSFTKNLVSILDLKELSESLLDTMTRGLNCTNAAMLLGERYGVFRVYNSTDKAENGKVVFHANHPLTNWFGKDEPYLFIDDLDTIPLFKSLWKNERAVLDTLGVELILPIRLRNSLIGLLILSAKKSGKNYYSEELELLTSLASSAAAMIENATLYERAKLESITDDLTKLFNHRHFNQILASSIADPAVGTFSLLLADMDYFKLYNDIYGHHEGDVALEQTARIFRQHVGARGTVFRYGGEEFAALLPGVDGACGAGGRGEHPRIGQDLVRREQPQYPQIPHDLDRHSLMAAERQDHRRDPEVRRHRPGRREAYEQEPLHSLRFRPGGRHRIRTVRGTRQESPGRPGHVFCAHFLPGGDHRCQGPLHLLPLEPCGPVRGGAWQGDRTGRQPCGDHLPGGTAP